MMKAIRFNRIIRPSMLLAACSFLGLASSAQALHVDLGEVGASDSAISVQTQTQIQQVSISIFGGGTKALAITQKTFEFTDGPIMIHSVSMHGAAGATMIYGPDGMSLVGKRDAEFIPRLVAAIQTKTFGIGVVRSSVGVDIDLDRAPSNPIPEPGAALLFAAGLGAIAVRTKRSA